MPARRFHDKFTFNFREGHGSGFPLWEISLDLATGKGEAFDLGKQHADEGAISVPMRRMRRVALQVDTAAVPSLFSRAASPANDLGTAAIYNTGQTLAAVLPNP
jgi:hypothetical protein